MQRRTIRMGEAIRFGWETLKNNWPFLVSVYVVYLIISGLLTYFDKHTKDSVGLNDIVALINLIFSLFFSVGFIRLGLKYLDGERPGFDVFTTTSLATYGRFVGASILLAIAILFSTLLLVIPGIYVSLKYSQLTYLLLDKNVNVFDAFDQSGKLTQGVKWQLIGFALLQFLIILVGAICLGIGLVIALPICSLASVHVYRQLLASSNDVAEQPVENLGSVQQIEPAVS